MTYLIFLFSYIAIFIPNQNIIKDILFHLKINSRLIRKTNVRLITAFLNFIIYCDRKLMMLTVFSIVQNPYFNENILLLIIHILQTQYTPIVGSFYVCSV